MIATEQPTPHTLRTDPICDEAANAVGIKNYFALFCVQKIINLHIARRGAVKASRWAFFIKRGKVFQPEYKIHIALKMHARIHARIYAYAHYLIVARACAMVLYFHKTHILLSDIFTIINCA